MPAAQVQTLRDPYPVEPVTGPLDAVVEVPGSKSIANRALVCAALADGATDLDGLPDGDDTAAMLDCLELLGLGVERHARRARVVGGRDRLRPGPIDLPARLAGTTSRFLTALAALGPGPYVVDGEAPLRARPMAPLHEALASLGAVVTPLGRPGHLPVQIERGTFGTGDVARPAEVALRGDLSSQFLSALVLVGPCLPGGLVLHLTSPLVSRPYLELTAAVQEAFGVHGVRVGATTVTVPGGGYRSPGAFRIEADASSASYPLAAAAICGGTVRVPGLAAGSLQGDASFCDVLAAMGCTATRDPSGTTVTRTGPLHGIDVDMVDHSDLVPTLAVVAAFAATPTTIRGVGFIRSKESDRLGDLCAELQRAGVRATETEDGLVVEPSTPHAATLGTHHDHRLAMAFALLGLAVRGIRVADPSVVGKSWPGFWAALAELR